MFSLYFCVIMTLVSYVQLRREQKLCILVLQEDIYYGYSLESLRRVDYNEHYNLYFHAEITKIS